MRVVYFPICYCQQKGLIDHRSYMHNLYSCKNMWSFTWYSLECYCRPGLITGHYSGKKWPPSPRLTLRAISTHEEAEFEPASFLASKTMRKLKFVPICIVNQCFLIFNGRLQYWPMELNTSMHLRKILIQQVSENCSRKTPLELVITS